MMSCLMSARSAHFEASVFLPRTPTSSGYSRRHTSARTRTRRSCPPRRDPDIVTTLMSSPRLRRRPRRSRPYRDERGRPRVGAHDDEPRLDEPRVHGESLGCPALDARTPPMEPVIYFNRAFRPERDATISVRSRALNYGLGCFARHSRLQDRRRPAGPRVPPRSPRAAAGAVRAHPAAAPAGPAGRHRRRDRRAAAAKRDARRRLHSSDRLRELQRALAAARSGHERDGDLLHADRTVLVGRADRRVRLELAARARDRDSRAREGHGRISEQRARPPRGDGQRLHGSDSADRGRPRVGRLGRARVHRARRTARSRRRARPTISTASRARA